MRKVIYILIVSMLTITGIQAQSEDCACCTEDHKAFDFWLGEWEVFLSDGSKAGTNSIKKDLDNCLVRENWSSEGNNFRGSSINFYNKQQKRWEQIWMDNGGSHLHLKGQRDANQMILTSDEIPREDKPPYVNRITWTLNEDGSVRQLWEILVDGDVASVAFDGIYRKKS